MKEFQKFQICQKVFNSILPPNEFQEKLKKEQNLKRKKGIRKVIEMLIFYLVRTHLGEIYKIEIAPPARPTKVTPPPRTDIYREPIE